MKRVLSRARLFFLKMKNRIFETAQIVRKPYLDPKISVESYFGVIRQKPVNNAKTQKKHSK